MKPTDLIADATRYWDKHGLSAGMKEAEFVNHLACFAAERCNSKPPAKVKKEFVPPTVDEVKAYFKENGYTRDSAQKFFDYYKLNNWRDSKNNPIVNWKLKAFGIWFKPENKATAYQNQDKKMTY